MIQPDERALTEFDLKALGVLDAAKRIEITDDDGFVEVGEFIKGLKVYQKDLDATFDEPIKAQNLATKALKDAKERHAGPVREAEAISKGKWSDYQRKRQAQIDEENRQKALEQAKATQKALEEGKTIKDMAPAPTPTVMPKVSGMATIQAWDVEVTDPRILIETIIHNGTPFSFEVIRDRLAAALAPKLNEFVRATKGLTGIPGVKITPRQDVRAGTK